MNITILFLLLLFLVRVESNTKVKNEALVRDGDNLRIPLIIDKSTHKLGLELVIGNKTLRLVIDTLNEGIRLFQDGTEACNKGRMSYSFITETDLKGASEGRNRDDIEQVDSRCYDPLLSSSSSWCYNKDLCRTSYYTAAYTCNKNKIFPDTSVNRDFNIFFHSYERVYDGIIKLEITLEGNELVLLPWMAPEFTLQDFPIKLIRSNLSTGNGENWPSFHNFDGFIGLVGKYARLIMKRMELITI